MKAVSRKQSTTGKLAAITIKQAKPKDKPYKLGDGGGMFLLVNPSGSKYWRLKYRYQKKEKNLTLGVYPNVSVSEARQKVLEAKKLLDQGIDPNTDRKQQAKKIQQKNTLINVAQAWLKSKENSWKQNHKKDVERSLKRHIYPHLGELSIIEITTADILHVLRKLEATGALVMLSKVNQRINHIFAYACIEEMIPHNPASNLSMVLKKPVTTNFKHVPIEELPLLLRRIAAYDEISGVYVVTQLAMQLLSIIFIRTGELRRLQWMYINYEKAQLEIPASLMKMGNPHIVPLSRQALEIIERLKAYTGDSQYLFCQQNNKHKPMSENAVLYALYSLGYHGKMTGHGFRHIASTQLNEMGYRSDLIEKQLAHGDSNKIRAVYNKAQYLPERSAMMQAWADYLESIKQGADVVPIRKGSQ